MSIKIKIILIIVPLFVFMLILTSTISSLTTRSGLVNLAIQSFSFKANQLEESIIEQWNLLEENNLTENPNFITLFEESLLNESISLIKHKGELIFAYNQHEYKVIFDTLDALPNTDSVGNSISNNISENTSTGEDTGEENKFQEISTSQELASHIPKEDITTLTRILLAQRKDTLKQAKNSPEFQNFLSTKKEELAQLTGRSWIRSSFNINGKRQVGYYFTFTPLDMVVVLSISSKEFTKPIRNIIYTTIGLIFIAITISIVIILMFSNSLVQPLQSMIKSMHHIIETNSFDKRVEVKFKDEVGDLSNTFNVMIDELDRAYKQIKQYAFSAVLAKKNESKIRNIFQKYVPVNVINGLFKDPTSMLTGKNKELAIMFTDIRSFTTISENYEPDILVSVLNEYFEKLVDVIISHEGIIDKYIGDAIMAFFGAPVELKNSALSAITAGIKMVETIDDFNKELERKGLPLFKTGIGINYGLVTVGNIGSDKKMDYTAIGDAVNLGSRLEGLTKEYKQDLIFSNSMRDNVYYAVPCRVVDIVQVKGKTMGEKIYTTTPYLSDAVITMYEIHNRGVKLYLDRNFIEASKTFEQIEKIVSGDFLASMYIERCREYISHPPLADWNGTFIMTKK